MQWIQVADRSSALKASSCQEPRPGLGPKGIFNPPSRKGRRVEKNRKKTPFLTVFHREIRGQNGKKCEKTTHFPPQQSEK